MPQEIKNPGFEEGTPNDWLTFATGRMHRYIYPEPGRSGGSSVAIEYPTRETNNMAMFTQNIDIDPTKTYKLSGWMQTKNIVGPATRSGAAIQVDWKDANSNYLSSSAIIPRQKGDISWKYFEGKVSPNPRASVATIVLVLDDCSGKVWFDDISFVLDTIPEKRYKCTGEPNYQCIDDPNGPYTSLDECIQKCRAPGKFYECWTNYCQFRYKEFRLHNNMWGARNDVDIKQGVYYYENDGLGWQWNRPNPRLSDCGQWVCPTYPEVIIGMLPHENTGSTTPIFPIKVGNINSWMSTVQYQHMESPTDIKQYNLAYDIYLMDGNTKKTNFMIWIIGRFGYQPKDVVSDGINEYNYHYKAPSGRPETWPWHCFELKNQEAYLKGGTHTVNIKKLMDWLRTKENFAWDDNWAIKGMEFGSEVWGSKGKVIVDRYDVVLNGQTIKL